jgi:hypothetical protein
MDYKEINYSINFKIACAQLQPSEAAAFLRNSKCAQAQFRAISSLGRLGRMHSMVQITVHSGMAKGYSVDEDNL